MFKRLIEPKVAIALKDTPVVLINGARQTGKSTLAKGLITQHQRQYYTLDDYSTLNAATSDPANFINNLPEYVVLDEIQRAPELFIAIKASIDENRRPGRFLLTGSANVLLLPRLSESLAGRIEILTLWPLSLQEIYTQSENFIDLLFSESFELSSNNTVSRDNFLKNIISGGYPEVLLREQEERRNAWFNAYITTLLQRDVRELAHIEGLTILPNLLKIIAGRLGSLLNIAELSRSIQIPQTTLKRYLSLLETIFLIDYLPAWSTNHGKRLVKAPKIFLTDTGLAAYLVGADTKQLENDGALLGRFLENFIIMELKKQCTWSKTQPRCYHFRNQLNQEVDFVLENRVGQIIGIEIKASTSVNYQDFKGLIALSETANHDFLQGIVIYTGEKIIPFGKNLWAIPLSIL